MDGNTPLKTFLEIPYDELEQLNIEGKKRRMQGKPAEIKKFVLDYITKEKKTQGDNGRLF